MYQEQALFVTLGGWYENTEALFIAMEYFEEGDLEKCCKAPIKEVDVQVIAYQIADGLKSMHAKEFYLRDIKPQVICSPFVLRPSLSSPLQNILVKRAGPDWWIKIGDFGIAKCIKNNVTQLKTAYAGLFMAPESRRQEEAASPPGARDIWSLG